MLAEVINETLSSKNVGDAHKRIAPFIHQTPLLTSQLLNSWLGHDLWFKVEGFQKIGAFKARGALNTLLSLKEKKQLPQAVTAFSSGNHAQAVAWAAGLLGVKATIFLPEFTSPVKIQATRAYGAEVILTKSRQEAEAKTKEATSTGAYFIHPFDNPHVIAGQGTACFEALNAGLRPHAIFAPCGGGGLLSGTWLAARAFSPDIKVFAGEPANANDASISYRTGEIFAFPDSPKTLADGARTLSISPRTFSFLKQLNGFYEISEETMVYWTQWLTHLLKIACEPTSALAMAAAYSWLKEQPTRQKVLVILSGGNIAPETMRQLWAEDCLVTLPKLPEK